MKLSVCLPKTHKLFQTMTSWNSLYIGKFKFLDLTKASYAFEALRIDMKLSTHNHTQGAIE